MKFDIRLHCYWSIVKCTGSKCLPMISVKQFAALRGKCACSSRTVWSERAQKSKFCYIRKSKRNIHKYRVNNFRKHCYVTFFLSLPYISSIVFLVTEEEPDVIYLRHSFPNKIKVLSKLVQRIISFTNFHAQFFIH